MNREWWRQNWEGEQNLACAFSKLSWKWGIFLHTKYSALTMPCENTWKAFFFSKKALRGEICRGINGGTPRSMDTWQKGGGVSIIINSKPAWEKKRKKKGGIFLSCEMLNLFPSQVKTHIMAWKSSPGLILLNHPCNTSAITHRK